MLLCEIRALVSAEGVTLSALCSLGDLLRKFHSQRPVCIALLSAQVHREVAVRYMYSAIAAIVFLR